MHLPPTTFQRCPGSVPGVLAKGLAVACRLGPLRSHAARGFEVGTDDVWVDFSSKNGEIGGKPGKNHGTILEKCWFHQTSMISNAKIRSVGFHQGKWNIFAADVGLLWFYQQIWVILRKMHLTCQQKRGLTRQNDPKWGFNLGSVLCHLCHFILLAINDEKFIQPYRYTSWGPLMFAGLQTHEYYIVFYSSIPPINTIVHQMHLQLSWFATLRTVVFVGRGRYQLGTSDQMGLNIIPPGLDLREKVKF